MENIFQTSETGKAQADGAVTLTTTRSYTIPTNAYRKPGNAPMVNWQLSFFFSATPSNGTFTISVQPPGATGKWIDLATTVTCSDGNQSMTFTALAAAIKITPASLDADKTYDVYAAAW